MRRRKARRWSRSRLPSVPPRKATSRRLPLGRRRSRSCSKSPTTPWIAKAVVGAGRAASRQLAHGALGDVDRHVGARRAARSSIGVQQRVRLARRARARARPAPAGCASRDDLGADAVEDLLLGARRVVLGQARDLLEELASRARRRSTWAEAASAGRERPARTSSASVASAPVAAGGRRSSTSPCAPSLPLTASLGRSTSPPASRAQRKPAKSCRRSG